LHDREFKPAKDPGVKVPTAAYPYKEEGPAPKKSYKNEDGEIETGPRNFTTIPLKKGNVGKNTSFGGAIPYIEDDFNLKKKLYKKELEEHRARIEKIGDGKPFSSFARKKKWGTFNEHIHVYGEDVPLPAKEKKEPVQLPDLHDGRPFKPSSNLKTGQTATLGKFPEHKPDPPKEKVRVKKEEDDDAPPGFKCTKKFMSRPTPSVATNFRNLKASFPSAFRR